MTHQPETRTGERSVAYVLGPQGPVGRYLPGYEPRPGQIEMGLLVEQALTTRRHAVIEAGTGVGKSLGYLVPAVLSGKRVIVSTANKALQEQLVRKDIPFLKEVLSVPFTSALVKGRGNYLCLDRFSEEEAFQSLTGGGGDFARLKTWAAATTTGDVEEFTDRLGDRALLGRIVSTRRSCIGQTCTHFADCYVERMRGLAEGARIIVCNHALLLADLHLRDMGAYLLPDRDAIIIDEAHHLEASATSALTVSLTRQDVVDLVENTVIRHHADEATLSRLLRLNNTVFGYLEREAGTRGRRVVAEELPAGLEMHQVLDAIAETLRKNNPSKGLAATPEERRFQNVLEWVQSLTDNARLIAKASDADSVRYVESPPGGPAAQARRETGVTIQWAPISVDTILKEILFDRQPVICTSATLAVGERFDFFTRNVGCADPLTLTVPSHFDYAEQAVLYVPRSLPEYRRDSGEVYNVEVAREMYRLLMASQGRAFCLFTSYRTLDQVYAILSEHLPFLCLKQGPLPRAELLRRFKENQPAVLFATRSFWEGVDVVGDALSLVIIDKMPFSVPDDPVIEARVARMKARGEDWFGGMVLPEAILGLKQGFGRLIRSTADRGVVAILDSRLITRGYGSTVLDALPPARQTTAISTVREFFARGGTEQGAANSG
ncbi:MAG: ATP-dependent DNA helicase [Chloroflexota bacterium]